MSYMFRTVLPYDQWILDELGEVKGLQLTDLGRRTLFRNLQPHYLSLFDTTTQTALANTATATTFNTVDLANGISLVDSSKITFSRTGVYNVQFSTMFTNPETTAYEVSVWLAKNGAAMAATNTDLTVPSKHGSISGTAVAAWNFFVGASAGDYVQLMWSTPIATISAQAVGAQTNPARPSTPSVILTVNQVD